MTIPSINPVFFFLLVDCLSYKKKNQKNGYHLAIKLLNTLLKVDFFFLEVVGMGRDNILEDESKVSSELFTTTPGTDKVAGRTSGILGTSGNPTESLPPPSVVVVVVDDLVVDDDKGVVNLMVVIVFTFKVEKEEEEEEEEERSSKSSTSRTGCNLIRTSFFRRELRSFLMSFGNVGVWKVVG